MHLRDWYFALSFSHARRTSAVAKVPTLPKIALYTFINID